MKTYVWFFKFFINFISSCAWYTSTAQEKGAHQATHRFSNNLMVIEGSRKFLVAIIFFTPHTLSKISNFTCVNEFTCVLNNVAEHVKTICDNSVTYIYTCFFEHTKQFKPLVDQTFTNILLSTNLVSAHNMNNVFFPLGRCVIFLSTILIFL
jgi:hypothetical protein